MSRPPRPSRPGGRAWVALVCAALVAVGATVARGDAPPVPPEASRTEIRFPTPVRYAIVQQGPGGLRLLVAQGDLLFHPQNPTLSWIVLRVEVGSLILREAPRGPGLALPPGGVLPGFPGWRFTGTVWLEEVHYRYKVVEHLRHPDPVLVALEGSRAVLEVEVLRSAASGGGGSFEAAAPPGLDPGAPARALLDRELLEKIRVREAGPGRYEIPAADVEAVLENAGRVLADLWPSVQPSLSLQTGLEYRITSAAGDGVLSKQGFTVTAPKLAERAGIQVGDTILRVNGQPVDGFASLYGIFRAVRQDPAMSTVQVELDRGGTRLTKTYRIR